MPNLIRYVPSSANNFKLSMYLCQSTIAEWNSIFIVGSVLYILPAIIYWIFGSAKVQTWNELPDKEEKNVPQA